MKQAKTYSLPADTLAINNAQIVAVVATGRATLNFTVNGGYPPYAYTLTPTGQSQDFINSSTGLPASRTGSLMPSSYIAGASFPGSSLTVISHNATAGQAVGAQIDIVDANGGSLSYNLIGFAA